ncbi:MAG: DivIVA protein [Acidimicrobiales bacterium]|nr:DivIVA protein [Acidimicrobiales bacterium]
MALTPDEIAGKEFLVGLRGYDKDEVRAFLAEVADELRTAGPAAAPEPAPAAPAATAAAPDWTQMGEEVAAVLRTAHEQAATLRAQAEAEIAHGRQAGADDAASIRREAEAFGEARRVEAEADREEARRILGAAQDEALGVVADAQQRAERMLEGTERKARERAAQAIAAARDELDRLRGARALTRRQVEEIHGHLGAALESTAPVDTDAFDVDITVEGGSATPA